MQLEYDPEANALYVRLRELRYAYNRELDDSRIIDYAIDRKPIGIELLNVSLGVNLQDVPECEAVGHLLREHGIKVLEQPAVVRES